MVISHKYKLIFIHIGKTGGDAITHSLKHYLDNNDVIREGENIHKNFHKHAQAWDVKDAFDDFKWKWEDYFSFVVLRNPYEILHSDYWFHRYIGESRFPEKPPEKGIKNYGWFMKCWQTKDQSFHDYVYKWYGHWDRGFYENYACDRVGNQIVNFVAKQENLEKDFDYICEKINLKNVKLIKANTTLEVSNKPRPSVVNDFSEELKNFVEKTFYKDFKMFNYKFEDLI